ncbi:hypothetical protein [Micromonospora coxensis]|uniref:hypothetical protein n=1 Tax=Micromonospora coxensis TaxID=356852 RepID=UPI0012FDF72A|nr:hypothetical protein [Micromonospora coxensis]
MTGTDQSAARGRLARLARPAVILPVVLLLGAALFSVPFQTRRDQDRWAVELRERGRPAQAYVYDVRTERSRTTVYVRYALDSVTHEQEIACVQVCPAWRSTVPIRVSRTDPGDFVTDYGQLSGHRGRVQGVLGAVGFVLLAVPLVGLAVIGGGRLKDALTARLRGGSRPRPRAVGPVSMPRSKRKHARGRRPND